MGADLVAIRPDDPQAAGDRLARKATLETAATIPIALTFLFGSRAQVFGRRRPVLLALGTAAQIALFEFPEVADVISARAAADVKAAERLLAIAQSMGEVPGSSSGLDAAALRLVGASPADLIGVVTEQNRQVDVADRYGERGNRGLFGLSLLALGAVLVGLGAVLGIGLPGRVSLAAASLALLAAAAWGGSALLV